MFDNENKVIEEKVILNDKEIRTIFVDYYFSKYNKSFVVDTAKVLIDSSKKSKFLKYFIIVIPTEFYDVREKFIVFFDSDEKVDVSAVQSKLSPYVCVIPDEEIKEIFKSSGYFLKSWRVLPFSVQFEAEATMQIIDIPYKVLK